MKMHPAKLAGPISKGKSMKTLVSGFVHDESGATAIEYGLIAALIALAIITGATSLGTSLNAKFKNISNRVTSGT